MNGGFLPLPLILVLVPLGREALDRVDLHVAHPLGLPGHPLLFHGVRDGVIHVGLFPDRNESSEAEEKHGSSHNCLPLIGAPVHSSDALAELPAIQFGFFIN